MRYFIFLILFVLSVHTFAQSLFTRQDTLRGSVTPARAWWDVQHYGITVKPDYNSKTIAGQVTMKIKSTAPGKRLQIDLQEPMQLEKVTTNAGNLTLNREGNVYYLTFPEEVAKGAEITILLQYSGKPREAKQPPWDGGWIWAKDAHGRPWMSVACQGLGASVWFPCKDYQGDEPDLGASLTIIVPDTLVAVGNGRLIREENVSDHLTAFTWEVKNPINSYNIIPYIGKYVHWREDYAGEAGTLDCQYWVLDYELEKAKSQFRQAQPMLTCFEHWFGKYPFYEDGFKLVQSPHLGMEHQSAVAYGNGFKNGYLGSDLSQTGWGLKWDFILIHESGHEWFGNNITTNDIADMWVHESFTNYSETIFTMCEFGLEAGNDYVIGTRKQIRNDIPIVGPYGVNKKGSGDMYYKGGNLIHTIRQLVDDDEKFRMILRGLNERFWHSTVTSAQVEAYMSEQSGKALGKIFDQYLRTTQIPTLEYKKVKKEMYYRWATCVPDFDMPVKLQSGGWIKPTTDWQRLKGKHTHLEADRNFYIVVNDVSESQP
ncbi:MAG: M1 family metallopeptidase [Cyclobacteriaceae bacterium]|nr:MAG: M1 family metallopeptidase [Cyclobacteriaceae bacterium]